MIHLSIYKTSYVIIVLPNHTLTHRICNMESQRSLPCSVVMHCARAAVGTWLTVQLVTANRVPQSNSTRKGGDLTALLHAIKASQCSFLSSRHSSECWRYSAAQNLWSQADLHGTLSGRRRQYMSCLSYSHSSNIYPHLRVPVSCCSLTVNPQPFCIPHIQNLVRVQ